MDIYRDYFTREQLLLSLANTQYIPGRLAAHFETLDDVNSTTVAIEALAKDAVSQTTPRPRGAPSGVLTLDPAAVKTFETATYSEEIPILADSVLNARRPGDVGADVIMRRRDRAVQKLRNWADLTHEYLRIGAAHTTANAFGTAPDDVVVAFGAADDAVRASIHERIILPLESALDGLNYTGLDAYCSDAFWMGLIVSKSIKETYLNTAAAAELRNMPADSFTYGGVTWHRYRPQGAVKIADGKCKVIPRGVSGLFVQAFAPDDTLESVGQGEPGEPYYLRSFDMDDDKGFRIKMQTHPLMVCTRPPAIQTLKLS